MWGSEVLRLLSVTGTGCARKHRACRTRDRPKGVGRGKGRPKLILLASFPLDRTVDPVERGRHGHRNSDHRP
jgi:hypothetical protein